MHDGQRTISQLMAVNEHAVQMTIADDVGSLWCCLSCLSGIATEVVRTGAGGVSSFPQRWNALVPSSKCASSDARRRCGTCAPTWPTRPGVRERLALGGDAYSQPSSEMVRCRHIGGALRDR